MGFYATESTCERREKMHPPSKNRVVGSRAKTYSRTGENWQITQCSRLENQPTPTTTASGVHYYGLRYYSSELGRWINRDPIGEDGHISMRGVAHGASPKSISNL